MKAIEKDGYLYDPPSSVGTQSGTPVRGMQRSPIDWDKIRMDVNLYLATNDSELYGTGLFKVYFDPDRDDGLGEVRVDVIDPITFVMDVPEFNA